MSSGPWPSSNGISSASAPRLVCGPRVPAVGRGPPRKLDAKKLKLLHALYADKSNSVADILRTLQISKSTLYRYVRADKPR